MYLVRGRPRSSSGIVQDEVEITRILLADKRSKEVEGSRSTQGEGSPPMGLRPQDWTLNECERSLANRGRHYAWRALAEPRRRRRRRPRRGNNENEWERVWGRRPEDSLFLSIYLFLVKPTVYPLVWECLKISGRRQRTNGSVEHVVLQFREWKGRKIWGYMSGEDGKSSRTARYANKWTRV